MYANKNKNKIKKKTKKKNYVIKSISLTTSVTLIQRRVIKMNFEKLFTLIISRKQHVLLTECKFITCLHTHIHVCILILASINPKHKE